MTIDTGETAMCFVHPVYSVAKFYMANPFVYTTESCDEALINLKYSSLITAVCKRYTEHKCPFRGRKDCYKRRLSEVRSHVSHLNITSDGWCAVVINYSMLFQQLDTPTVYDDCTQPKRKFN